MQCENFIKACCHFVVATISPYLIKFSQLEDIFIYDFVVATKVCQGEIYELYTNLNMKFKFDVFEGYKVLLNVKHDSIIMWWMIALKTGMEHLTFESTN